MRGRCIVGNVCLAMVPQRNKVSEMGDLGGGPKQSGSDGGKYFSISDFTFPDAAGPCLTKVVGNGSDRTEVMHLP